MSSDKRLAMFSDVCKEPEEKPTFPNFYFRNSSYLKHPNSEEFNNYSLPQISERSNSHFCFELSIDFVPKLK